MNNTKRLLRHLTLVERDLSEKYGGFSLFGMCQRENTLADLWDLIVSAPWLTPNVIASDNIVFDALQQHLGKDELFSLDAVPMFAPEDPRIQEIQDEYEVEHGLIDLGQCQLFDMDMERVYLITAKRRAAPVSKEVV
jgi:hypothetical protein